MFPVFQEEGCLSSSCLIWKTITDWLSLILIISVITVIATGRVLRKGDAGL